jgi:hypothetical protein
MGALSAHHLLRDERGSVLMFVAVGLPVLLAVFAIALDVGNWFVHHRVLQNQVDAAALAGGSLFVNCFNGAGSAPMITEAAKYAGGTYNLQYGGALAGTESFAYNSTTFPSGVGSDTVNSDPCVTPFEFDVKGSEQNLPLIFGSLLPGSTPLSHIDAHARVQLKQATIFGGLFPLAVPSPSPNYVFARFVDETTGNAPAGCASPCEMELLPNGTVGSQQLWAPAAGSALTFPIPARLGVRIRMIGGADKTAACGQPLVDCYDGGSANGLAFVRGWNSATPAPAVRNAWLLPGSCLPDAYFTSALCNAGVQAEIDLGNRPLTGAGVTVGVTASVDGSGSFALTQGSLVSGSLYTWNLLSGMPLTTTGPHDISLSWTWSQTSGTWFNGTTTVTCTTSGSNPCKGNGTFANVQRAFVADNASRSGPLQRVQVGELRISTFGADSFQAGTSHSLFVTVSTLGTVQVQSLASDPVITLRVKGSQNQAVDCDPAVSNLRTEIEVGCNVKYTINTGTACPSNLIATPQPWNCVAAQTGASSGQITQGWNFHVLGSTNPSGCSVPKSWPNWSTTPTRVVNLFLTPFNSFSGSGNATFPVIGAGTFYITGWAGDPCTGDDPAPADSVVGHFIKNVMPDPQDNGSGPCIANSLEPCIPILTR